MSTEQNFQQILTEMLESHAKPPTHSAFETQNTTKNQSAKVLENWWHSVSEMNKRHVFHSKKQVEHFQNTDSKETKPSWKPVGLPPEVAKAFVFFHENGWSKLTSKSSMNFLKKGYRKIALTLHPDRRSDSETAPFRELQRHYSVLKAFIGDQSCGT